MIDDIRSRLLKSVDVKVKAAEACAESVARAAEMLIACLKDGHRVYLCGNGGSAADCQHVAGELVNRFLIDRDALPAVALTTDTSILTSVANDYDFEEVFARQVSALVREGDCLVAISTSGNAANVLKAAAAAHAQGATVIALTGEAGGQLARLADCLIATPSDETPLVQETHIALLHILCEQIEKALFQT